MANLDCYIYTDLSNNSVFQLVYPNPFDSGEQGLLDRQSYDINQVEVYEEWTDANEIIHRETTRTRIQGTFTVGAAETIRTGFMPAPKIQEFLNAVAAGRQADGTNVMTLYVNNTNQLARKVNVFLTFRGGVKWDRLNNRRWATLTVDVMEK